MALLPIDIESLQNRLLRVCYVPPTSARLPRLFFSFLLQPLTVLIKQTSLVSTVGALNSPNFVIAEQMVSHDNQIMEEHISDTNAGKQLS